MSTTDAVVLDMEYASLTTTQSLMRDAARICSYLLTYSAPSLSDLTDEHLALAPTPTAKTSGWILGHLCITGDYARRKCGRAPLTPKAWGPRFAPGTQPPRLAADYPPMRDLRVAFEHVYSDLAEIAPTLPEDLLSGPNPLELTRHRLHTAREFFCYIMTGHLGYHLGQLSAWREALGMPARPGATGTV